MEQNYCTAKTALFYYNFWMKLSIGFIIIMACNQSYSQPIMTSKEGFYFTLKANNYQILGNAIEEPQYQIRWFDIFVKVFDKTNYENSRNDEFRWPQYSRKILDEVKTGIETADFNKIYSYTCEASIGKWNTEKSSFPITELWNSTLITKYPLTYTDFTFRYSPTLNNNDFDFNLRMDPLKAESFIASRKNQNGNINRKIVAKVIYNVVNMKLEKTQTQANLGIYMHKIIFMDGAKILGEIAPKIDYYDKVNLIKEKPALGSTVTDIDGNIYNTITIGNQVWMVENLRTTKFNDGESISNVKDQSEWAKLATPAYCWYQNDASQMKVNGALYNWFAVNTGKLAPQGWHVPTNIDWTTLTDYLGTESIAGGKLKEIGYTHWLKPNAGATNETGFTAIPAGQRNWGGVFSDLGSYADFWSSSKYDEKHAGRRTIDEISLHVQNGGGSFASGHSVRCIKD